MYLMRKAAFGASIAIICGFALAPNANARSIGGFTGLAAPPTAANFSCFSEHDTGALLNSTCGPTSWEVQLPIDNTGSHNVTVEVKQGTGPGSDFNIFCNACAIAGNGDQSTVRCGGLQNAPGPVGQAVSIAWTGIPVTIGGSYLFASCSIGRDGEWISTNYTP
jgi:hypothetical protein